jgi:predicted Zn-dependent protease
LKIYFSPLQKLNEKLEIFNGDQKVYSKDIVLKTLETFKDSIRIAVDSNKLKLILGGNKLVWNSAPEDGDLARPVEMPKDFDNNSVYGLYLQGKNYISFKDDTKAAQFLTDCLKKDPYYAPALSDLAGLRIRNLQYAEALALASRALAINTYDPAANYYYGLANLHLGNRTDAKDGFDIAASSVEYRSTAYTALSKLYFTENDLTKAIEYAQKSLLNNQYNIESLQLLAVLYRVQNNADKAAEIAHKISTIDPLNHFIAFEKFLWESSPASQLHFTSNIRNEMPEQTYLELGIWYQQLGRKEEALKIFSLAVPNAEVLYWRAYLTNKAVDLSSIQPGISFPFRAETALILENLLPNNKQWQLKYHLALIEWNRNNTVKAKELFLQCGTQPNDPAFYAAKASLMKEDAALVLKSLQQAIELAPQGWRYQKLLAEHYILQKQYDKALTISERFYKKHPENYVMGMLYAKALLLNKKYVVADAFLTRLEILPFEGATAGRQLYHEAKLMQAVKEIKNKQYKKALQFIADAKLWPENLGVGKPYETDIDERLENWLDYQCYSGLQDQERALQSLQKIIVFKPKVDNTVMNFLPANQLVSAWAIEKTATASKAQQWLQEQANAYPNHKIVQWCLAVYTKKLSPNLTEDEKDGEVRIIEALQQ